MEPDAQEVCHTWIWNKLRLVFIPFDASGDVQIIDIQKTMKLKV